MIGHQPIASIFLELERSDLLPAIVFRSARVQCDIDVQKASGNRKLRLDKKASQEIKKVIAEVIKHYDMDEELIKTHPHYSALVSTAIGAHHAGQLLMWRLLLEELMTRGLLKILVATGTVAAGVDFPARTVVITSHTRRDSEGYNNFTGAELQQMSGRAGRRGKDTVGFCLVAPSMFCDARVISEISKGPIEPLRSAYFPSASTVLNLLKYRNVDDLRYTIQRSLASFVDAKESKHMLELADEMEQNLKAEKPDETSNYFKKARKRIARMKRKANSLLTAQNELLETSLNGLKVLGYLEGDNLSQKGAWAANLCTSLVLELAEIIEAGLLDDASSEDLAVIVASLCGDPYRQYLETESAPLSDTKIEQLEKIVEKVSDQNMPGKIEGLSVLPNCSTTVLQWLHSESWQNYRSVLTLTGVTEGDAARVISQTADHLNQLSHLSETHPKIAEKAFIARMQLLRPPLAETIALASS